MNFFSSHEQLYARVLEPEAGMDNAPPLVFLHPTPLNHAFWIPVAQQLPGYRRILPDLRGHGRSPLGEAPSAENAHAAPQLTIEQLAADTVALLDSLGMERAVFAGCSIGGYTLYELWRTVPARVAGLLFCASKPQPDTQAERAKRQEWIAKMEPARLSGAPSPTSEFLDAMLSALLSRTTHREHPELVAEVRGMMEQVRPESIQAIQRGLGCRPDARLTARTVSVPTCVVAGQEDSSSTPEDLQALHLALLAGGAPGTYHQLADAGHYAPLEQPTALAGIMTAFLHSLPS